MIKYYKVLTHDLRPPVQGGEPVWSGELPYQLPTVEVDRSEKECAGGWNACRELSVALRIAGLWRNSWPSRAFVLTDPVDAVERKDKIRAAAWTVQRECGAEEIEVAIRELSEPLAPHVERMTASQIKWRLALSRPGHDPALAEKSLALALEHRKLSWSLRKYDNARGAWGAWDAWDAWDAWGAWGAWGARGAWDARAARDARGALTVEYAALQGWITQPADLLTVGLRDAYSAGLAIALPVAENVLGWAMHEREA